ncbi:MAG: hypothetical protein H6502_01995 [Candidatus Woesearchaeota archaeon]|nr:MAG: hypothetical protein H6502_01995 [Candidatus Woesearchaeota archaeon]
MNKKGITIPLVDFWVYLLMFLVITTVLLFFGIFYKYLPGNSQDAATEFTLLDVRMQFLQAPNALFEDAPYERWFMQWNYLSSSKQKELKKAFEQSLRLSIAPYDSLVSYKHLTFTEHHTIPLEQHSELLFSHVFVLTQNPLLATQPTHLSIEFEVKRS